MRLWSLHPQYLDARGLVALWREALLAQAVLAGQTRGYKHHPQLDRFWHAPEPRHFIASYLSAVLAEALRRSYNFDASKIAPGTAAQPLTVSRGQLDFEWSHLQAKLATRAPDWGAQFSDLRRPKPHPLFRVVAGGVAGWEVIAP